MRRKVVSIHHPAALPVLFAAAILAAGLLALVGAKPAWAELRTFEPAPSSPFPVGSTPTTVTNADFNRDGKTDLAAQNAGSNTVSVLLGKGDGTFDPKRDFAVGSGPTSVISADFNGNGKDDLAVSNYSSHNVSVLLGNGDGTFSPKTDFAAGGLPTSVTSSDLNGDGFADLAVSSFASNSIAVLLGDGTGNFQFFQSFDIFLPCTSDPCLLPPVAAPNQVIAADFNRDTRVDLATANVGRCGFFTFDQPGGISVLLGNGDGTFRAPRVYSMGTPVCNNGTAITGVVTSIAVTDVDSDGGVDLAATVEGARVGSSVVSNVTVRRGNGDGTFPTAQSYTVGTRPSAVTSADLDGDAKADLEATNFGSDNVSVLFNNGNAGFQAARNFPAGDGPAFVICPNLNADSFADLAVANQNSNNVSVLLNTKVDTTPPSPPVITSPPDNTIDYDGNFTVSGTAEANSTVELFEELASRGTATTNASGQWSKALTGVADGSYTYTASARDAAGNTSDPSSPLKVEVRIPPLVSNVSPPDQAQNVAPGTYVEATFSEAMNEASVEASGTFTLKQGTSQIPAIVTYDPATRKATLDPDPGLAWNATYTATIKGGAKDVAGNVLEADKVWTFSTANDTTAPSTTHALSPQPNAAGWNKENVTLRLSATDDASGVREISYSINGGEPITVQQSSVQIPVTNEGRTTISYHATDNAGNPEEPQTFAVMLDKTAPQITPGDLVNSIWRNVPLTGEFTASDSGSGLTNSADASFTLTASEESASANQPTVASRTVFDAAGNSTTRKVSALIDLTSPQATASSKPAPNAAGWNNSNVTVTLNATDAGGSGIKDIRYSATGAQSIAETVYDPQNPPIITTEGTTTISYFATDKAGNRETPAKTFEVKLDKSAPTLDTDNSDGSDGITPDNRQTGVSRNVEPKATFSEEMDATSLRTSAKLYQWNARKKKWQAVPATVSVVDETAALDPYPADPSRLLAANKKFKVTVTTGAKDLAGLPLSSPKSWTFTTGSR